MGCARRGKNRDDGPPPAIHTNTIRHLPYRSGVEPSWLSSRWSQWRTRALRVAGSHSRIRSTRRRFRATRMARGRSLREVRGEYGLNGGLGAPPSVRFPRGFAHSLERRTDGGSPVSSTARSPASTSWSGGRAPQGSPPVPARWMSGPSKRHKCPETFISGLVYGAVSDWRSGAPSTTRGGPP